MLTCEALVDEQVLFIVPHRISENVWFGSGFIYARLNLNLYGNTQQKRKLGVSDVVIIGYMGIERKRFSNCSSRSISASNDNFSP